MTVSKRSTLFSLPTNLFSTQCFLTWGDRMYRIVSLFINLPCQILYPRMCYGDNFATIYLHTGKERRSLWKVAMKDGGFLSRTSWSQARWHRPHHSLQGNGLQSGRVQSSRFWEQRPDNVDIFGGTWAIIGPLKRKHLCIHINIHILRKNYPKKYSNELMS